MRYHVLAADYDGTLATHGRVPPATIEAVRRLRSSGRKFILVTGRRMDDLIENFAEIDVCDAIVAENGAVIYKPASKETRALTAPPPAAFARELARRIGEPVAVGEVIVATWQPHESVALEVINEMGLELQIIFNKGAVMILPSGINKAVGLAAALEEMGLSPRNAVGVGDAENDHAFLAVCECAVAVANALPPLKERADLVTGAAHSDGVAELIGQIVHDDLKSLESFLTRHDLELGRDLTGKPVTISPFRAPMLFAGSSGGGKSTMATVMIEALTQRGYQSCIIDPEGDFRDLPATRVLGDAQRPPVTSEVLALLEGSNQNLAVSLIALPFPDRAPYFESLLAHLLELRARTGRPQWIIVDETHHVAPRDRQPSGLTLPASPEGLLYITVRPGHVSPGLLAPVDLAVLLGSQAQEALTELTEALGVDPPPRQLPALQAGQALLWQRKDPRQLVVFERATPQTERRRHVRKYATGELEPHKSFYFRGPEQRLNLRAHNLGLFVQMADGIDDQTWLFHLRAGDYSRWFRDAIRDPELALEAEAVEAETQLSAQQSRQQIRSGDRKPLHRRRLNKTRPGCKCLFLPGAQIKYAARAADCPGTRTEHSQRLMDTPINDANVQLQLIADALPLLVFHVDADERCCFANQVYRRWFGEDPAQTRGRPMRQVLGDDTYHKLREPLQRALQGQQNWCEISLFGLHSAELRLIEATCVPHQPAGGAVEGLVLWFEDVTERKRIEFAREQAQADRERLIDELKRTVRLNQLFTGTLSHDLRNPLQSMLTAAEILIRKAPDERSATTASRIVTSGNRMNRMIGQLLDFSRLRGPGGVTLEISSTDLLGVWRQAVEDLANGGGGRIMIQHTGNPVGQWDAERLAQVAANLLGNALRHGTPEGPIAIEIDGSDAASVTVHIHNGGAIAPDLLPKLFEPFQDGDRRGPRGDGLGLGLYITRQIIIAHGGMIDVTSSPGNGTELTIRLPRAAAAPPATPAA